MILYLHNLTASAQTYNDIGLVVPANGYFEIDTVSINDFLRNGSALKTAIAGGTYGTDLVVSKNSDAGITADRLTSNEAIAALSGGAASETYYDNTSSGLTSENVQNAIDEVHTLVGNLETGLSWRAPAIARILDFVADDAARPSSGLSEGDFVVTIDNGNLYKWSGSAWVLQGSAGDAYGVRFIDLSNATEDISILPDDTNPVETISASVGWALIVLDDGDAKQAAYVYDGTNWIKIADVDWGELPEAGAKVYANLSAFTTAKSTGSTFKLNEPIFIADINRFVEVLVIGTGVAENTDWAYVGASGNAIAGPAINYNTEIVLKNAASSAITTSGAAYYDTDIDSIVVYDADRSKWISAHKQLLQFGASKADGQYLTINGVQSGLNGFLMPRNAVITAIAVRQAGGLATKGFEIHVDGSAVGGAGTFALSSSVHTNNAANINVAAGSYIQIFASATGDKAENVIATIEIAYYK